MRMSWWEARAKIATSEINYLLTVLMSLPTSPASQSTPQSPPPQDAASEALADLRISLDEQAVAPSTSNGSVNGSAHHRQSSNDYTHLQSELQRTRKEKEALEEKYRALVERVTTLRKTLGDKLRQDAVRALVSRRRRLSAHCELHTGIAQAA